MIDASYYDIKSLRERLWGIYVFTLWSSHLFNSVIEERWWRPREMKHTVRDIIDTMMTPLTEKTMATLKLSWNEELSSLVSGFLSLWSDYKIKKECCEERIHPCFSKTLWLLNMKYARQRRVTPSTKKIGWESKVSIPKGDS